MYVYFVGLNAVADSTVFEVDVAHPLCACAFRPVDSPLIVVVEKCGRGSVWEVHVVAPVAERQDFLDSFIRCADFSFASGATCAFLSDGFPCDGAPASHDQKTAHRSILEELDLLSVWDRAADLAAPVGVTETLKRRAGGRRRTRGVGVRLPVVRWWVMHVGGGGS